VKIVHVYKDYHPPVRGGIEQTLERIARAQAAAGHDVTVVVSASGQRRTYEERIAGVRVVRVAEWARALSSPIAPGFPAAIGRERADLWHLHFPNPLGEVSWLMKSPPGALLVTYYCDVVRQKLLLPVYTPFVHRLLDRADLVQVISPQAMERAESPVSLHRERCRLVPLGIDLESFQSIDRDAPAARALRAKYGDPFVLFVGRLRYYKGLDVMLAAMPRISARLVIVGDGPMEEPLRRQAAELVLGDKVVFAGPVSDEELRAHLGAAAIGVLPSTHPSEAFGLAMVEYLAAGVPAVCTELGTGTTFVNADGETGVVVPPGDPVALAAGVERLVADLELRSRCGAAGRERASRLFSTPAMMRGLDELYAETIARSTRRR
jgi:rhamnosyl/mannosyltransferase